MVKLSSSPEVNLFCKQSIIMELTKEYWNNRYKKLETGWDVGGITQPLKKYFDQVSNKKIKILIPGSGNCHEAEYLFNNNFCNTYILDYSQKAISNFIQRVPVFPKDQIVNMNFFDFNGKFDIVVEQTFFCAIDIKKRSEYVSKVSDLLKQGGKLVGLFFEDQFNNDHPPFGGTKDEYIELFRAYFDIKTIEICYNSEDARMGRELFFILIKK